jgi:hypothetical protein
MQPQYAIDGTGWSVSFQRRVGAANRGALPFAPLGEHDGGTRVAVPLREGEALWIAVITDAGLAVTGRAGDDPLHVEAVAPGKDGGGLRVLDAVLRQGRPLPLGRASLACAQRPDEINADTLAVEIADASQRVDRIAIVLVTPELYTELTGLPPPPPSTDKDEYGGWRLP